MSNEENSRFSDSLINLITLPIFFLSSLVGFFEKHSQWTKLPVISWVIRKMHLIYIMLFVTLPIHIFAFSLYYLGRLFFKDDDEDDEYDEYNGITGILEKRKYLQKMVDDEGGISDFNFRYDPWHYRMNIVYFYLLPILSIAFSFLIFLVFGSTPFIILLIIISAIWPIYYGVYIDTLHDNNCDTNILDLYFIKRSGIESSK